MPPARGGFGLTGIEPPAIFSSRQKGFRRRTHEDNYDVLEVYNEVMGNPSRYTIAPTTLNFLKDARVRGYRLCLLTNQETVYVRRFLEAFDLLDTFQGVYISEELA